MQNLKKISLIMPIFFAVLLMTSSAKSTEECFEGTSRAIFKFNMALEHSYQSQIIFYKEISKN